ncbi:S phase cyclin A-associated protein in the endoplasmic reticulum (S phase cyclin A-associated protein in the ER) (Zinc finger protein 291) [Durusdinium trenchii]|uniref:S phase cyclin A-associated protein in the endoplasmic reticulum (S phase cyclin A-associated protein in the ER) (Zinc finger protein 291) n=1 Tax=Durusdinium trenchii TaxID=1381693 RepID=A0ABP0QBQ4_9DINO
MLCALKWLGLLCKSRLARLVLLLTGRVVLLADVATAYLEMHFADALKPQELEDGDGCFLGTLVCAYRAPKADDTHKQVLEMFHDTELFGVVGILVSILLSEGRREKGAKLPQTVISLCVQEFYHLLVSLLDYCVARLPASMAKPTGQAEESDLLHEAVVLLGFYCLQEPENQSILCYGEGQALLTRLAALPLHYFMDERGKAILFPTILASCDLAAIRSMTV